MHINNENPRSERFLTNYANPFFSCLDEICDRWGGKTAVFSHLERHFWFSTWQRTTTISQFFMHTKGQLISKGLFDVIVST